MMNISVLTLFPELYKPFFETSLIKKAQERGDLSCDIVSLFDLCVPKERADAPTFGHGPGLLIRPEIVERAVDQQEAAKGRAFKIFFSPQGKVLTQPLLRDLYEKIQAHGSDGGYGGHGGHCMLLPARYEGMDSRVEQYYADEIISLGNFVIMGGDLPAMIFLEGLLRFVPGVVGKSESVEQDSFTGPFVDYPQYTAPVVWKGLEVPEVLRSGNHAAQEEWRQDRAAEVTVKRHFDWVRSFDLESKARERVVSYLPHHYAALMHTDVLVQQDVVGNSSVTSIDIHDIARSSKTYGLSGYFVVTPLEDQQKITERLLRFWQEGDGIEYNPSRHEAVSIARLAKNLDEVIEVIEQREGVRPLLVATSARRVDSVKNITYYDQEVVWKTGRPVLFLFGTASGLAPSILQRCDFVLGPIRGFSRFNHLSVRSAVAIVLDRWLGIQVKR